jgi:putative OPT family oligopeptide transporter
MFEKLVGGIFGAGRDLPWDLVGYGAAVGVAAIVIDRFLLQPRDTKFRLHPMPLAVGMYLPWTVTFPILLGGLVYRFVDRRSHARGDSAETRQAVIHRGLLFSSGLVAGEAIMGILIAVLVMTQLKMPLLKSWVEGGLLVDLVSLGALAVVIGMLVRKSLRKRPGSTD